MSKEKLLLNELIKYSEKSNTFNPHFLKSEMLEILGWSEGEFNIVQSRLGDKYCYFVGVLNEENRYAVNISECLSLQNHFEQEKKNEKRHNQLIRLAVLVALLGAVTGVALSKFL